ncbi:MAG TPA: hypothetical protein VLK25_06850 [Allosphingosinicella sp.]|nr:hypothetical protein [Allosphingosinicella sp.]
MPTIRRAHLLPGLLLFVVPATAQEAGPGFTTTLLTNIGANPRLCNLDTARRIAFEVLVRDYRDFQGQCVAVRGYWDVGGLSSRDSQGRRGDARGALIGIYGETDIRAHAPRHNVRRATIAGVVRSCEYLWQRADGVAGYCHSHQEGPVLGLTQAEFS